MAVSKPSVVAVVATAETYHARPARSRGTTISPKASYCFIVYARAVRAAPIASRPSWLRRSGTPPTFRLASARVDHAALDSVPRGPIQRVHDAVGKQSIAVTSISRKAA